MHNLRAIITSLFCDVSAAELITQLYEKPMESRHQAERINTKTIRAALGHTRLECYSDDELNNLLQLTRNQWMRADEERESQDYSVFHLLANFGVRMLCEEDHQPLCRYDQLLRWRMITQDLGDEPFVTAWFAWRDIKANRQRSFFSWRPVVGVSHPQLQSMLSQGMAENHFHLKGSAPNFSLSWISLMNHTLQRHDDFNHLEKEHLAPHLQTSSEQARDMHLLVKKAAAIRVWLFYQLKGLMDLDEPASRKAPEKKEQKTNEVGSKTSEEPESLKKTEKETNAKADRIAEKLKEILCASDHREINCFMADLQRRIDGLRFYFGHTVGGEVPDYCISKHLHEGNMNNNLLLAGERIFLYRVFRALFTRSNEQITAMQDLFYAYLVIKAQFRREIIQANQRVGFNNFKKYQDRKGDFIPRGSVYDRAVVQMAINSTLSNQAIRSLEARFRPQERVDGLTRTIEGLDAVIADTHYFDQEAPLAERCYLCRMQRGISIHQMSFDAQCAECALKDRRCFYTAHFTKEREKLPKNKQTALITGTMQCRHFSLRKTVKAQAMAIKNLRHGYSLKASRLYGIDAASAEIGCRPEVFAQAFRYLKQHLQNGSLEHYNTEAHRPVPCLGATYHVGEDYLDIVDGLRAIDEAIYFLGLQRGDRLGHAIALGVDAREYYQRKSQCLILPRQDLLDNLMWMYVLIEKHGVSAPSDLKFDLKKMFNNLFLELYNPFIESDKQYSVYTYFDAWKLRADNPELYISETKPTRLPPALSFWQRCNRRVPNKWKSISEDAYKLNHWYHYNHDIKEAGRKQVEFRVKEAYINAVIGLQKMLQKHIAQLGISIETNPSSNVLIGRFGNYSQHPLKRFYNLGLEHDHTKIEDCAQLHVSINTDDQGVFNTYLENEYALMALGLEKETDDNGNRIYSSAQIFDWLERIRRMGLEQTFNKTLY